MRLVHLSDIHWRGSSRHDEYKRAFSKMFDELKILKPDAIVIGGDIVHSKTQGISPELIDHLVWWFTSMAEICDVHIMLGNHDGNLMNLHRQDAISPIINALNNEKIFLYKNSGVYAIGQNFNLCVFSLFDEEGWAKVKPVNGSVNIALFHGSVAGSHTDMGWELESDMNVEFFEPFDFCFLGDIHSKQYLGFRNKKPWIAYPGSTIMQDYGETSGKGYLLWDINSRDDFDVTFKHVEHDREFKTIDWSDLKTTVEKGKTFPIGTRLRIKTTSLVPQIEIRQAINELTTLHGLSEVVFKDEYVINHATAIKQSTNIKHDLRNVDYVYKLFQENIGEKLLTTKQWAELKSLISKYIIAASSDDMSSRNLRWQLQEIKFDNLFGYGDENYINFENLSGITGIFGPNKIGKSSIIGTLLYALFNGSDRGAIQNLHIMNSRKDFCKAEVKFKLDGKQYKLERQSIKNQQKNGNINASTSLNLYQIDDKNKVVKELNGEQRSDTDKNLRALIGSQEDMLLTGIATQGDMNNFINAGASYRDLVISRLLDLLIFEKMAQYAKDESSNIKLQVKNLSDKNWDIVIATKKAELQNAEHEIQKLDSLLKEKRELLQQHKISISELTKSNNNVITQADINNLNSLIEDTETNREKLLKTKTELALEHEKLSSAIVDCEKKLLGIPVEELKTKKDSVSKLKETLSEIRENFQKEKQILTNQIKSVDRLKLVPCGDAYPTCHYIKDSHSDKQKLSAQNELVENLLLKTKNVEADIQSLHIDEIDEKLKKHSQLLKIENEVKLNLVKNENSINTNKNKIDEVNEKLINYKNQLKEYLSKVVADDNNEEINSLKKKVVLIEKQIDIFDNQRINFASQKGTLTSEIKALENEKENYTTLKSKWMVYELFIQAASKKGIPAQIIETQLPVINAEIAKILHGVVDYVVFFEKPADSNSTEIYIDYGDSKRLIELGCGMEKMISSLAIRVALQNASSLPRSDFLIIDEGFGTLDETNIEACNRLLISLKRFFKNIIVISHIDAVKDVSDNVIEVVKNGKDSYVKSE